MMSSNRHATILMATVVQLCWLYCALADDAALVRVTPKVTDEILANPGMGWETFHRTANDDENIPAWIPSTVHYARWGWGTLEPENGKIDFDFLDGVLNETREAGQQLALRVMCCSSYKGRPYHPDWLDDIGGKVVMTQYGDVVDVGDSVSLPEDLSPGIYTLSLAVVGEEDTKPVMQLGIEGRSDDGWYQLSTMPITKTQFCGNPLV